MRFSSSPEFSDFTSLVLIKYFYDSNNVRKCKFEFQTYLLPLQKPGTVLAILAIWHTPVH